jgi:hypothetical protein
VDSTGDDVPAGVAVGAVDDPTGALADDPPPHAATPAETIPITMARSQTRRKTLRMGPS